MSRSRPNPPTTAFAPTGRLGGRAVGPVGLGCMRLSYFDDIDEPTGTALIITALDAGITLLDTADVYGPVGGAHRNERLIRKAIDAWKGDRDRIVVATKGGHTRRSDDSITRDGRPASLIAACEASLVALGGERIDLYQYHGVDPEVPLAESVGALRQLQEAGKIGLIGLSNVGRRQIAEAMSEAAIATVQNELSPLVKTSLPVVELCGERGITFLSYAPGGGQSASSLEVRVPPIRDISTRHGVTAYGVAVAWARQLGPHVIPLAGATSKEQIEELATASHLVLDDTEVAQL
jgi:aryl-alcohol dehydrogenase-like predicted oxidoreductase